MPLLNWSCLTGFHITTFSLGAAPALALDNELFQLCSNYPYNSQCEGYDVPIPLENRDGKEAKCLSSGGLSSGGLSSGAEKAVGCKVLVSEDTLTAYLEFGEPLDALGDQRGSSEVMFPLSAMESFAYSEDSRVNIGAVVLLGLPGLFVKDKTASFNIRYTSPAQVSAETGVAPSSQQLLFVLGRGEGRKLRLQMETATGLIAEIDSIE